MQNLESGTESSIENTLALSRFVPKYSENFSKELTGAFDKATAAARPKILHTVSGLDRKGTVAVPLLVKAFEDPDPAVRKQAIIGLSGPGRDAGTLSSVLLNAINDPDADVKIQVFRTIRTQGERIPDALKMVASGTQEVEPKVRIAALNALPIFKKAPMEPVQILEQMAKSDDDPEVRAAAFTALAETSSTQNPDVLPFLEQSMETEGDSRVKGFISSTINVLRRKMAMEKGGMMPGEQLGR